MFAEILAAIVTYPWAYVALVFGLAIIAGSFSWHNH